MENRICLIDADIFGYYILPNKNIKDNEGNIIGKEEDKSLETCCQMVDDFLDTIFKATNAEGYILALTKGKNFRYSIDPNYKANRKNLEKPKLFNEFRDYLETKYNAVSHSNLECDDILRICKKNIPNSIIVSPDKDLLKLFGEHYNPRTNQFVSTTKKEAESYFFMSMLTGDSSDGIKGIPGIGTKKAFDIFIKDGIIEFNKSLFEDMLILGSAIQYTYVKPLHSLVLETYIKHFGENKGIKEFYKNYNLLYILDEYEGFVLPEIQKIESREYGRAV